MTGFVVQVHILGQNWQSGSLYCEYVSWAMKGIIFFFCSRVVDLLHAACVQVMIVSLMAKDDYTQRFYIHACEKHIKNYLKNKVGFFICSDLCERPIAFKMIIAKLVRAFSTFPFLTTANCVEELCTIVEYSNISHCDIVRLFLVNPTNRFVSVVTV